MVDQVEHVRAEVRRFTALFSKRSPSALLALDGIEPVESLLEAGDAFHAALAQLSPEQRASLLPDALRLADALVSLSRLTLSKGPPAAHIESRSSKWQLHWMVALHMATAVTAGLLQHLAPVRGCTRDHARLLAAGQLPVLATAASCASLASLLGHDEADDGKDPICLDGLCYATLISAGTALQFSGPAQAWLTPAAVHRCVAQLVQATEACARCLGYSNSASPANYTSNAHIRLGRLLSNLSLPQLAPAARLVCGDEQLVAAIARVAARSHKALLSCPDQAGMHRKEADADMRDMASTWAEMPWPQPPRLLLAAAGSMLLAQGRHLAAVAAAEAAAAEQPALLAEVGSSQVQQQQPGRQSEGRRQQQARQAGEPEQQQRLAPWSDFQWLIAIDTASMLQRLLLEHLQALPTACQGCAQEAALLAAPAAAAVFGRMADRGLDGSAQRSQLWDAFRRWVCSCGIAGPLMIDEAGGEALAGLNSRQRRAFVKETLAAAEACLRLLPSLPRLLHAADVQTLQIRRHQPPDDLNLPWTRLNNPVLVAPLMLLQTVDGSFEGSPALAQCARRLAHLHTTCCKLPHALLALPQQPLPFPDISWDAPAGAAAGAAGAAGTAGTAAVPLLSADLADTLVELLQASTRLVLQVPAVQHSTASEQQEQAGAAADYATRHTVGCLLEAVAALAAIEQHREPRGPDSFFSAAEACYCMASNSRKGAPHWDTPYGRACAFLMCTVGFGRPDDDGHALVGDAACQLADCEDMPPLLLRCSNAGLPMPQTLQLAGLLDALLPTPEHARHAEQQQPAAPPHKQQLPPGAELLQAYALSKRSCAHLGCPNLAGVSEGSLPRSRKCAGCRTVHFCSEACAAAAWPTHRSACKQLGRL